MNTIDEMQATVDRQSRNEQLAETKAQKIERMREELRTFRVETLQDAARILEQLDEYILRGDKVPVIEFLKETAENIKKDTRWKNSSQK